ncbi:MAG: lysylphosphatidylglycerol synthase transmembrane domain-containing protein [Acidimicrobiia bacterium]
MGDATRSRRRVIGRIAFLVITLIAFYFVLPGLLATFDALPRLRDVYPAWFAVVLVLEAASFAALWDLQGIALGSKRWFDIACSHAAGNAVGRAVPGGVAAGGALQLKMLAQAGFDVPTATTALAAVGLLSTSILFALPVLALPAVPFVAINGQLVEGALLAVFMFFVVFGFSAWMLRSDRAVSAVGRTIGWVADRFHIGDGSDLGARVVESRNVIRNALRDSWKRAVPAAAANQLFDFLALEASLLAVGASVDPLLVLLAYVAAATLSMIPITPGGLGFVEAGLAGVLTLAGASPDEAVLATLLYRLFSYWLPLPIGLGASIAFSHRHRGAPQPAS